MAAPSPATRATMLRAKSTTVAEGTLIPAVLESALDSSRPGPARALVTQDVRGWDGTRILISRGTKLFGEYHSDVQPGQSRVQIMWTRLVRPDGATMMLQSPAGDPQGRVGIKGKVNNHFLAKFGGAILQTGLDIGSNLASRIGGNSIVVAVPGSVVNNTAPNLVNTTTIQPTIRVHEGTSISVFVAHDLDFTSVESER
jgi:type IV secretion system protein VirB10